MAESKTPVYLENVIYVFKKSDTYYKSLFALKNEVGSGESGQTQTLDTETLNKILNALQSLLEKANNSGADLTVAQINALIDKCFEDKLNDADDMSDEEFDESLKTYFEEKMATLTGGD